MHLPHMRSVKLTLGQRNRHLTNELLETHALAMAPRAADPSPWAFPDPHPDGATVLFNATAEATPYIEGLTGIGQPQNFLFVNILLGSVGAILLATLVRHWLDTSRNYLRRLLTLGGGADQRFWMYNRSRLWAWTKRHIVYAPLFGVRHNRELQFSKSVAIGTLPSRFDSLLLGLYCASNIAYAFVLDYGRLDPYSVIAELRGRSGSLSMLNLVLAVVAPLRNSPLASVFGLTYDTLNLYHRCFGRIFMIEATVHTVCWGINNYEAGNGVAGLRESLAGSSSFQWGMVGTVIFIIVAIIAWGPIRHAAYETFLNVHRLLVFVGIVGVYIHLVRAGLPQTWYCWVAFALWASEWIWRTYRVWYYNFSRQRKTEILVEALPSEAVRVTFTLARTWRWHPGCYIHIYVPKLALWSSHPFSVAWAEAKSTAAPMEMKWSDLPPPPMPPSAQPSIGEKPMRYSRKGSIPTVTSVAEATHQPPRGNITLPREANVHTVSCVIRAREGLTRKLYQKAMAAGNTFDTRKFTTWGAVEGPYGGHYDLTSYGTVILFAGGVGITHQVSFIYHLMLQYQAGISSTRKILLVWSVPNTEALEWVRPWMDQIMRMEGRRDVVKIQIFVTKPRRREEVISSTGAVQMFPGRCNPSTIMAKEVPERIGAMAVTICGPGAFADPIRAAVRSYVEEGVIDFMEEAFTY